MQVRAIDLIKGAARILCPNGNDIVLTARQAKYGLETLNSLIDSISNNSKTQFSIKQEDFPIVAGTGTYTFGIGGSFDSERPIKILAVKAVAGGTPPPLFTADFSINPTSGNVGDTFYFTDLSDGAVSWLWDFGDGNTSTEQNPTNTYSTSGDKTITLTAHNAAMVEDVVMHSVTVNAVVVDPYPGGQFVLLMDDLSGGTIPDEIGHAVTNSGVVITSDASKFGGASALFNYFSNTYLNIQSTEGVVIGIGDFTLSGWFRVIPNNPFASVLTLVCFYIDVATSLQLETSAPSAGKYRVALRLRPDNIFVQSGLLTLTDDFHYFSVCSHSDAGTRTLRFHIDGIFIGSISSNTSMSTPSIYIGARSTDNVVVDLYYNGYIDDVVLQNTALYTSDSNYTVPATEYPT